MVSGNISSEKIDLLIYGPSKPIVDNGFSDQFVLHKFETTHDLERLSAADAAKIRGAAITYNSVRGDGTGPHTMDFARMKAEPLTATISATERTT